MSVIIVNWNGKHYLEDCLSSLRRQTFRDFETIMVDNGSTDESVEYVRQQFPEVRIIAEETNLGFTGGNISGFALATGNFIVLLNNDTEAHPDWLQAIHNAGVEFPSAGSFASKMMYFDDRKRIENCGFEVDVAGTTVELGRDELDGPDWHCALKVFGACGGAVAYRRSMLERIGFLDPDFFMIYEDVDLSFRAQLFGYDCVYVPQAIVYHRYRSTLRKQPATQVFYSQRNIDFVYLKNLPAGLILRSAPRRILYELGAAIYFLRIGSGPAFFRAKFDVFKRLPSVLRKRKAIQRNKALNASQLRALMHGPALTSKLKKFATLREASPKMLSGSDSVHSNR